MFSQEERLASFTIASSSTSTSAAKKRQSTKAAAASSSLQWPHPVTGRSAKSSGIPTPAILASHGFYHSPTQQSPDAVSHFLYPDIHIDNWQPSDDPLARLEDALPGNGWCRIFRSSQMGIFDASSNTWTWKEPELLPTSKEMVQARKETFGSQWPYDGKKGWKPTSKKLAEAGFCFNPTQEEPDNAKCIYCEKSLGGWEKSDDPVHEHQRRVPRCAFFNCELRDADGGSAAQAQTEAADTDQDMEPPVPTRRGGGKRAVSAATRKASATVGKGKKSAAAVKAQEEEGVELAPTDKQESSPATSDQTCTQMEEDAEVCDETPSTTKKGGRKTRSVSTKKLAAKAQVEEEAQHEQEAAEAPTEAEEDEVVAVEEPVKTLSKKKSATGLSNGVAAPASASARPTRAASRRATKAINLLSDEGLNRKLRRPDEQDLERRELALSDPIPFPTAPPTSSEDSSVPATDPIEPTAVIPKKSRFKSKKLDQQGPSAVTPREATPEPRLEEEEERMEEDPVRPNEDMTIIEHHDDDAKDVVEVQEVPEEPVEEPKRRGGRGAKSNASSASASKALSSSSSSSGSGLKSRKASTKPKEVELDDQEDGQVAVSTAKDALAFPSMSSEADVEPALDRSLRSVSNALKSSRSNSKSASSESVSSASSRKGSSKRSSTKPSSAGSEVEPETASQADSIVDVAVEDALSGSLPNTGSQATIRGAPRSSSSIAVFNTGRAPLAHLPQLTSLDLDESERRMTLGAWLQSKAEAAANEMRSDGEAQLADLENHLRLNRMALERRLRGRA